MSKSHIPLETTISVFLDMLLHKPLFIQSGSFNFHKLELIKLNNFWIIVYCYSI